MSEFVNTFGEQHDDELRIRRSLLSALAASDDDRFDQAHLDFCERHLDRVLQWFASLRFVGPDHAEDAAQEFFLALRRKFRSERAKETLRELRQDEEEGVNRFRGWLRIVAKRWAIDFMRHEGKRRSVELEKHYEPEIIDECVSLLEDERETVFQSVGAIVVKRISNVSERDWQFFIAAMDASHAEVAERYEATTRSVDQATYRVRKGLRELAPVLEELGMIELLRN